MDGRLHQLDKRDSRALFSLALILLLFYLISETRVERSDDAPCVDKMNGMLSLSLFSRRLSARDARQKVFAHARG